MVRIIFWRVIYESLSFLKWLGLRGKRVKYFAYGANLDPRVLRGRWIEPFDQKPYFLKGFYLAFNHRVPFLGVGMGSIVPSEDRRVFGVIYEISYIDLIRLDCMEANTVFRRYLRNKFNDAEHGEVHYYISNTPGSELLPTTLYLGKILAGYSLHLGDESIEVEELKKTRTLEKMLSVDEPKFLFKAYGQKSHSLIYRIRKSYDCRSVKLFAKLISKPAFFERFGNR